MQASFFMMLPSILLSGFMFPFRGMPVWAQWIGEALPATHFMRIVRGVMLKGAGFDDISTELAALLAMLLIVSAGRDQPLQGDARLSLGLCDAAILQQGQQATAAACAPMKSWPNRLGAMAPPVISHRLATTHAALPAMTSHTAGRESTVRVATKAMKAAIGSKINPAGNRSPAGIFVKPLTGEAASRHHNSCDKTGRGIDEQHVSKEPVVGSAGHVELRLAVKARPLTPDRRRGDV